MDNLLHKTEKLIGKAMKMWDMKEFRPENIDPVVRLLIACVADESTRLEQLIDEASSNINKHLIDTLLPNHVALGSPAYGMIQAKPVEPVLDLHAGMTFYYDKPGDLKKGKQKQQIGFSPALPMRILRADLKYVFSPRGLKVCVDHNHIIKPNKASEIKHFLIGFELDENISSLNGLSFFLVKRRHWNLTEDRHVSNGFAEKVNLSYCNNVLEVEQGFDMNYLLQQQARSVYLYRKQEMLSSYDWVKPALYAHDKAFFRIKSHDTKTNPLIKKAFPDFFDELFDEEVLESLDKQPLVWLELGFDPFSDGLADDLDVFINALPVINIQNRMVTLSAEEPVKSLSIGPSEQFMGISRHCSFDLFHNALKAAQDGNGPYLLRTLNMEQDTVETYCERLEKVVDEIETNFSLFYEYFSLDEGEVETLREALQPLKLSLLNFAGQATSKKQHYLIFNKENATDVDSVEIHYMFSNGSQANEILVNEKLSTNNTRIDGRSLRFITKTRGGSPPLTQDDKKRAMDYLLISQNKLVSKEDILRYCHFYLRDKLVHAEANIATIAVGQGLRNCLVVKLSLNGKKCDQQDAALINQELEQKFHQESASVIPVKVQTTIIS